MSDWSDVGIGAAQGALPCASNAACLQHRDINANLTARLANFVESQVKYSRVRGCAVRRKRAKCARFLNLETSPKPLPMNTSMFDVNFINAALICLKWKHS